MFWLLWIGLLGIVVQVFNSCLTKYSGNIARNGIGVFILLKEPSKCFHRWLYYFTLPTYEGFDLFISSPTFVIFYFVGYGHPSGCEMIRHYDFIWISLMIRDAEYFNVFVGYLHIFFGEMFIQVLFLFLKLGCL